VQVFISYSNRNFDAAQALETALAAASHSPWRDQSRFPVGQQFVRNIWDGLRASSCFVAIDTSAWRDSYWCKRELLAALRLRKTGYIGLNLALVSKGRGPRWADRSVRSTNDVIRAIRSGVEHENILNAEERPEHSLDLRSLPPGGATYFGFSDMFARMDRWFFNAKHQGIWVHGLGGGGKSALVGTWLTAATTIGYRRPITLHATGHSFYEQGPDGFERRMLEWIPSPGPDALVILDGLERVSLRELRRIIQLCGRARIIATSRDQVPSHFAVQFQHLELRSLDKREAGLMVGKSFGAPDTKDEVLSELGGHPLALSFAAAYAKSRGNTDGLLSALRERTAHPPEKSLRANLQAAESALQADEQGQRALSLLMLMSVAGRPVTRDQILSALSADLPSPLDRISNMNSASLAESVVPLVSRGLVREEDEFLLLHPAAWLFFRDRLRAMDSMAFSITEARLGE
jgi:TIR domain